MNILRQRAGFFKVTAKMLDEYPYDTIEMFASLKFVPMRVEYLYHLNEIEYIGYSELFREIEEGEVTPEYNIIVTKNDEGDIIEVKAEEKINARN